MTPLISTRPAPLSPAPTSTPTAATAGSPRQRRRSPDCDRRLDGYHAALEVGTEPSRVGLWIAEVRAERLAAERQLADAAPAPRLSKDEIKALVASLHDMVAVLRDADPADKAAVYAELGISLTYPHGRSLVESRPACSQEGVGGGT
jgi:hypothetical protein